ncbi:MAG: hypothetical protein J6Y80_06215 [Victivallales bacterium]|nr:hypothetical protein [Victivallales bacterium]
MPAKSKIRNKSLDFKGASSQLRQEYGDTPAEPADLAGGVGRNHGAILGAPEKEKPTARTPSAFEAEFN